MGLELTQLAADEVRRIVQEQGLDLKSTYLRVGVKGGGCAGFSYVLDLTEDPPGEMDDAMESKGIKIVVDMKSNLYLEGCEIDFKQEMMTRGFTFKNPNATTTCGCGSSFAV